jgi:uncharacterized protein YbaP (TraB family)
MNIFCLKILPAAVSLFLVFGQLLYAQKSIFWKITGPEIKDTSYLFGTIHLIPSDRFFLPEGTEKALFSCQKLVMEMDLSDPSLQLKLMGAMMMDSGKTLENLYTPARYKTLTRNLEKKHGLSIEFFAKMKPVILQQTLMVKNLTGSAFKSYEKELQALAEKRSIPISGLETLEDQIRALDAMSLKKQAESLFKSAKNGRIGEKAFRKMVALYVSQDLDGMLSGISKREPDFNEYEDALLKNRNKNWIAPMRSMMAEGSVFFAVGAGHLGGKDGVIALLRAEGFNVNPF